MYPVVMLTVGGNVNIVDYNDDDAPIASIDFANGAHQIGDDQKMKLGQLLRDALMDEMVASGILAVNGKSK